MRSAKMPASDAAARSSRPVMRPEAEVMDGEAEDMVRKPSHSGNGRDT
jgi:hypothetical protein